MEPSLADAQGTAFARPRRPFEMSRAPQVRDRTATRAAGVYRPSRCEPQSAEGATHMNVRTLISLAAIASAIGFGSFPASAASTMIWVSGHGSDAANCGAVGAPCRTFQFAHDQVAAGGQIYVAEPAPYGPVTITKTVSIVNAGGGAASVRQANAEANAITIKAGPDDVVYLRGLEIDGLGAAAAGISVESAGSVSIVDCVVRRFKVMGVHVHQTSSLQMSIADTFVADNGQYGIVFWPQAALRATLTRVRSVQNRRGLYATGQETPAGARFLVSAVDSVFANNTAIGVISETTSGHAVPSVSLLNAEITGNSIGAAATKGRISLSRSFVVGNDKGVVIESGLIYSRGDNTFRDNPLGDVSGGALTPLAGK
jgi:hypothetical protein